MRPLGRAGVEGMANPLAAARKLPGTAAGVRFIAAVSAIGPAGAAGGLPGAEMALGDRRS